MVADPHDNAYWEGHAQGHHDALTGNVVKGLVEAVQVKENCHYYDCLVYCPEHGKLMVKALEASDKEVSS